MIDKRRLVAHHEAAHAVADQRFGYTIYGVTISGNQENGGRDRVSKVDAWMRWEEPPEGVLEDAVVGCLAGFAAEVRLAPDYTKTAMMRAKAEFESAADLLRLMGEMDREDSDGAIPGRWIERASAFVNSNWAAITAVAEALIRLEKLYPDEVDYLIHIADGESEGVEDLRMWCAYQFRGQAREGEARYRALLSSAGINPVPGGTRGADACSEHLRPGFRTD